MGSLASQIALLAENRAKILRYAFVFQFIASIPFMWFATIAGKQNAHLLLKGTHTAGTIVSVVPVHVSQSATASTSYEAVVSFSAAGDQFRFQEWKGTSVAPTVGTPVPVIYDFAEPDVAMIDRGYLNYLPWAPCAAIGAFLFLVALKGLVTILFRR